MNETARTPFEVDEQLRIRLVLSRTGIFQQLPQAAIDDVARRVSMKRVLGGDAIMHQDESADALYVLMAGRVKVVVTGDGGRGVTLAILRTGAVFGEMALFDGSVRSASGFAIEPVTALVLSRDDLFRHLQAHPQAAFHMLGEMSRRLRRADETIAELALCDVESRLVRRLVHLAREDMTEMPEGLLIRRRPIQQELANMVGSCRETVSRTFNDLVRRGLLQVRGRSLLVSRQLLDSTQTVKAA